jgi:small conductance mechanosensitive channel
MNPWRVIVPTVLLILLTGLLPNVYYNSQAIAQKPAEAADDNEVVAELPPEKVGEKANELLTRINENAGKIERYKSAMAEASVEDRLVFQLQGLLLQNRVLSDTHKLADALLVMEKTGKQPELRKQVESILPLLTSRLWFYINHLRGRIDTIRERRVKATADERYTIENEIAKITVRLDDVYEMSVAHINKMELIGMDTKKARTDLAKLLTNRGEELLGRIALAVERIGQLEAQLLDISDDVDATKLLAAVTRNLETNVASLETTIELMDGLELKTDKYRQWLVTVTGDLSSGLTDINVAINLMIRAMKSVKNWLSDSGPEYLVKVLLFLGILFVFRLVARFVRAGIEKTLSASQVDLSQLARRMILSTASNLIIIFGLLVALSQFGISLGPLLAGLGVAGFIVGFALQDTLANFAAGVMILLYRPYDMGDLVDISGVYGRVHKMNLVSTTILTLDNETIIIPNSKIWGDVIKNVTAQDIRRIDMVFGISYSDDIPKAESLLNDILKSHDKILDKPEPIVRVHTLGASSVDFVVRPWVKVDDYWEVYWDVTKTVKLRFDDEGVSIPFPQRDVHVYNENILAE